ncbi:VOC family protein (plasmid) [Pseudonocardia bannensis]|uniref:Biphenyl 2,3-dioxygenase n=1 Tax=Pseudonocardia bannensis TaxID=630973 RepID=A0A848DPB2_9PSEU|nr:VOC family protein [Pseudonocardia bannensis]NMH94353.1 biphenyl 2,3-dioxygenase [Pseudonocardia bannensis]
MTPPTKFAHAVFGTHRYREMVRFYETVFESTIQSQSEKYTFMTYDEEHHRHAIVNLGPAPEGHVDRQPGAAGLRHLAYTWDTIPDLMSVYRRVRDELGVRPVISTKHGPTLSMYYEDPDGNRLEFQVDLLDPEQSNEFMATEAFAANPLGEPFDPEELCRGLDAGEPIEDHVLRSDQPRVSIPV